MAIDTLGDASYEAYFKTRGGAYFLCRVKNIVNLTWSRRLNEPSEATITIALNGLDPECCDCVATVNPWEHELAIFRNGVEVWVGPVTGGTINLQSQQAKYSARDLSAWLDKRWIEVIDNDVDFEEANISEVYEWLLKHAYYRDPWNMDWVIPTVQVPIDRTYVSTDPGDRWGGSFTSIGQEMRDLGKSGIDMTVIRRTMITGDLQSSTTVKQRLIDQHWAELPTIEIIGTNMATEVGVGGGNGGFFGWYDDQIWIERADTDDAGAKYGLLQSFFSAPELDEEDTNMSPNAITQQAYSLRELKKEPFVYVKGGTLSPKAPLSVDDLVPGDVYRVDLTQTCRTIESDYRLFQVSASFGKDGEQIGLELTPLGADALR